MSKKININICEICKNKIPENEIKVCESCDAKYHEECFNKNKKCLHENEHIKVKKAKELFGINKRDFPIYINKNADYFINSFEYMEEENTILTWNWSAFFFAPFYLFYRKMLAVSIPIFALFSFYVGTALFYYIELTKHLKYIYNEYFSQGILTYGIQTPEHIVWVMYFLNFLRIFIFIIMILCGLFSNYIYKDYVVDDILKLKEKKFKKRKYNEKLSKLGAPYLKHTILLVSLMAIVALIFVVFNLINL